jgi:hypothetical protein
MAVRVTRIGIYDFLVTGTPADVRAFGGIPAVNTQNSGVFLGHNTAARLLLNYVGWLGRLWPGSTGLPSVALLQPPNIGAEWVLHSASG